jgi:phage anti-repressor protein
MSNFKDFLLNNSLINKTFINDFFEIIREDYFEVFDQFLINSNKLQSWLNISSRKDFHFTIKHSYVNNIDYIITTNKDKNGKGGRNEIIYMLTPDCAKMILQSSKSKKGIEVRKYFIEIEKMLYKYKDILIKNLTNELTLVKNNQKIKPENNKKKIYIFKALNTDQTLYKLGKSKNIKKRLNSHNSALANDLIIVHEFETENMHGVEQCIKGLMRTTQYRKYKEVYQVDLEILKKFLKQCDDSINFINKLLNNDLTNKDKLFMHIPIYD